MAPVKEKPTENDGDRGLLGLTILITRPRNQVEDLLRLLSNQGAKVIVQPVIEILPIEDRRNVNAVLKEIGEFGWIVFVSVNGVTHFLDHASRVGIELKNRKKFGHVQIAAIGSKTARELENRDLIVNLIPKISTSAGVAEALIGQVADKRVLLVRADRGSDELASRFHGAGVTFREIVAYQTCDVTMADPEIIRRLKSGEIAWVTVTSAAIAQSLVNLFGEDLRRTKLVSISPNTSAKLCEIGFPPVAEAMEFNMPGVVQAIMDFEYRVE